MSNNEESPASHLVVSMRAKIQNVLRSRFDLQLADICCLTLICCSFLSFKSGHFPPRAKKS